VAIWRTSISTGLVVPDELVTEASPYVWTRMAFGRFAAAVNSVIYWAANPIWLGGSLTITAVSVFGAGHQPQRLH
jgi:hypothetical protein